MKMN